MLKELKRSCATSNKNNRPYIKFSNYFMKRLIFVLFLIISLKAHSQENKSLSEYLSVLTETGQEPVNFVNTVLDSYDLILFDDALHLAKEPFDFYQTLIRDEEFNHKVKYIFIEAFSIASQPHIDKYFKHIKRDSTILLPVFQNDFSGYGWRYETYLDLLGAVWDINTQLPESEKIRVICVDQPIYWEGIKTREDYNIFQKSLIGRDYFMYKVILKTLNNFENGERGIFLSNTRHTYKRIKTSSGEFYWNTGTFFFQWHPLKTYSVRFHNVNLSIESTIDSLTNSSAEGLDKISHSWIRMNNGLWDKAFKENGNKPVAISLQDNIFGKSSYVGNHMLNIANNQTMYDAYDGLIFLAPLEQLHFSAKVDFIYTEPFIQELKRRILLLHEDQLSAFLNKNDVDSLDDFIKEMIKYKGPKKNTLVPEDTN